MLPPAVRGLGSSSGINFMLKDLNGLGHDALVAARDKVLERLRPEWGETTVREARQEPVIAQALREPLLATMLAHDIRGTLGQANRILHLSGGTQQFFGTTEEYLRSPVGQRFAGGGL